jgi:hypothetical protein
MTTDAAAAQRHHLKVTLAVLFALAGLGLASCSGSPFDSGSAAQQDTLPPKTAALPAVAKISVAPIIGAPDAISKQIHQEFTSAVEKQRVSVVTANADYTLRAYVVAAKDKNTTKVSYIWDVTDTTGKRVNRITGEEIVSGNPSKDPWAALTPAVAQNIATKAANSFMAWLPSQHSQAAVASNVAAQPVGVGAQPTADATTEPPRSRSAAAKQPTATTPTAPGPTTGSIARDGPVMAIVPSVTGAPGDGSTSLTAAIRRELTSKGISVSDKPIATAYRVEGTVSVGSAKEGKQPIHIEWQVKDPQGKKLGTVSQRNDIPEGSLDGAWEKTADQAAGAAAQGIIKLLPQPKAVN